MTPPPLDAGIIGGLIRMAEGLASAAPTLIVGLLIAAVFRYYFGPGGIRDLFGGDSLRSLPQSWAIGMLLPVCSIGVLPILVEMRRAKVKPGALSAFALSAPLFNPLSLLYGLTLSQPSVVLMFAFGSLAVVTLVGLVWDRYVHRDEEATQGETGLAPLPNAAPDADGAIDLIGVGRLVAVFTYMTRTLVGPAGFWTLVGLSGLMLLSMLLPFGAMQYSVERDDWTAPATMTAVAVPAYATPMLAMSQLGMMFQHANSPGAAFVLLVLGAGVNLATLAWMARSFGTRSVLVWFGTLVMIVVAIAYSINRPLIPPGVEPAGHTHAFDIYTNPIQSMGSVPKSYFWQVMVKDLDIGEQFSLGVLAMLAALGLALRWMSIDETLLVSKFSASSTGGESETVLPAYDRIVSPKLVGGVMIGGLIVLSVVMCYGYYPPPRETLKEIAIARAECLSAANSGQTEHAAYWLEIWDDWSRRLEVGTFLRNGEVRPYQRMQGYLIRKKLELLEHELEHDPFELEETRKVVREILATNSRWVAAFGPGP
jgi:uncharacterized membrane protein YraQ (UPF0718 family)